MSSEDISVIASRVSSLEGRLDDNIDKINNRLDQIVDLMQKVTQLQEREINNAVQINELKISIKETNATIKEWNAHIHDRMDRHYNEIKVCRSGVESTMENMEESLSDEIKVIEDKNLSTQTELAKWLNRGIGAWALASVLLIVLQALGAYVVNGVIENGIRTQGRIEKMEMRSYEIDKALLDITRQQEQFHGIVPKP